MRTVDHHHIRSADAQRIHILEFASAFSELSQDAKILSQVLTRREPIGLSRLATNPDALKESEAAIFETDDREDMNGKMKTLVMDGVLRSRLGRGSYGTLQERTYSWTTNTQKVIETLMPNSTSTSDCSTAVTSQR